MATGVGTVPGSLLRQRALELLGLSALAITQPFFDLLSRNSEIVAARAVSPIGMVVVAIVVICVPTLVGMAAELVAGQFSTQAARVVHWVLVAGLATLLVMQLLRHNTSFAAWLVVLGAIVIGAALARLVSRSPHVRSGLRVLAAAQVLFVVTALAFSPLTDVVFANDGGVETIAIPHPTRVVMLVLDEFPLSSLLRSDGSGTIDDELFPNFAAFANTSHWYRNTTSISPFTDAAVPAILSGMYPKAKGVLPSLKEHPDNLFTALGGTYELHVHESLSTMCPPSKCAPSSTAGSSGSVIGRTTDVLRDAADLWWQFASPQRPVTDADTTAETVRSKYPPVETADRFIKEMQPTTTPQLDLLHVLLPHNPWQYLADRSTTRAIGRNPGSRKYWVNDWASLTATQRHLMQVQATDSVLGQLIARLRTLGAYDDSLIVVTADHGVSLATGEPNRDVSRKNAAHIAWVPLFIKYPHDSKAVVDDRPAENLDVTPTIVDFVGAKLPWKADGRSLLQPPVAEFTRRLLDYPTSQWHPEGDDIFVHFGAERIREVLAGGPNGTPGDDLRLYRMVPNGELINHRVTEYATGAPVSYSVHINREAIYDNIRVSKRVVPWADMTGTVADLTERHEIAVAVNGIICAVAPLTPDPKEPMSKQWWVRLCPGAIRSGANRIDVYDIQKSNGAVRLAKVDRT